MHDYLSIIKEAFIFFPFIAFIMSVPFILIEYHKFGSISKTKVLIIYSFVLYLLCAYFLVILPLPSKEEVLHLTTPRVQLMPFNFILDFINNVSFDITNYKTYFSFIRKSFFYVPIYNLFLTLPFGIYLKYYFGANIKKVILDSFLLSLFFELTQLSGLYFIYERGYRLFDVDDLLLNVMGGVIGYLIAKPLVKYLPKREKIEMIAKEKGKRISGFKRSTSFILDFVLFMIFEVLMAIFINQDFVFILSLVIYYVIIPFIFKGKTFAYMFINLKVVDYNGKNNLFKIFIRVFLFCLIYFIIPFGLFYVAANISRIDVSRKLQVIIWIISLSAIFLVYAITFIKYLFTNKPMLYEKLSRTKLISTIK